jgi:hypothetical protein
VDRRSVGGFRGKSKSGGARLEVPWTLRLGRGEGRNSSIRSVSGTGSIAMLVVDALGRPTCQPGKGVMERRRQSRLGGPKRCRRMATEVRCGFEGRGLADSWVRLETVSNVGWSLELPRPKGWSISMNELLRRLLNPGPVERGRRWPWSGLRLS